MLFPVQLVFREVGATPFIAFLQVEICRSSGWCRHCLFACFVMVIGRHMPALREFADHGDSDVGPLSLVMVVTVAVMMMVIMMAVRSKA